MLFKIILGLLLLAATHAAAELTVTEPSVMTDTTLAVDDLTIAPGASLDLRGVDLQVAGRITVAANASLVLGPHGDRPTTLTAQNESGFWIDVQGHLASQGEPRTLVDGLSGDGLSSVVMLPGGVKVHGTADLRDITIRNGTAGIIVERGGDLHLADAELEDLYLMGVAALGQAHIERVRFIDNIIAVSGRDSCQVTVRDVYAHSLGGQFQMTACPIDVKGAELSGGSAAIVVTGAGTYRFEDVAMYGYQSTGLRADGRADVVLRNVTMDGSEASRDGIRLKPGNTLDVEGVTIHGHPGDGVHAQGSTIRVQDSSFHGNGGYGIRLVDATWTDWRTAVAGLAFGTGDDANGEGAVSMAMVVQAAALDEDGAPVPGLSLQIRDGDRVVFDSGGPAATGMLLAEVPLTHAEGEQVLPAGPFTFRADHPTWPAPREGPLDASSATLLFDPPRSGVPVVTIALVAAGVLLLGWALLGERVRALVRRNS